MIPALDRQLADALSFRGNKPHLRHTKVRLQIPIRITGLIFEHVEALFKHSPISVELDAIDLKAGLNHQPTFEACNVGRAVLHLASQLGRQ